MKVKTEYPLLKQDEKKKKSTLCLISLTTKVYCKTSEIF